MTMWRYNPEPHPCGQCSACCVVFRIEEFEKPQFIACSNLGTADCGACTIYDDRPKVCSEYQCGYLAARTSPFVSDFLPAFLEDRFRPDRVGIVFDRGYPLGDDNELIEGTCVWPNAQHSQDAMDLFRELSRINPVLIEAVMHSDGPTPLEPCSYHWYITVPDFEHLTDKITVGMQKMKAKDPDTPPIYMTLFSDHGHKEIRLV